MSEKSDFSVSASPLTTHYYPPQGDLHFRLLPLSQYDDACIDLCRIRIDLVLYAGIRLLTSRPMLQGRSALDSAMSPRGAPIDTTIAMFLPLQSQLLENREWQNEEVAPVRRSLSMNTKTNWGKASCGCTWMSAMSILSACGEGGDSSKLPEPVVTISVEPTDVVRGDTVVLQWSSTEASSCSASGEWRGPRPTSGTEHIATRLSGRLFYTLTCIGPGGSAESTVSVASHRGVAAP
jgi:hypothetical protein